MIRGCNPETAVPVRRALNPVVRRVRELVVDGRDAPVQAGPQGP